MSSTSPSEKPRRVLYVIGSLAVGGAERHVVAVAMGLRRRGWQTCVFALSPQGPLRSVLEAAGVQVMGPMIPARLEAAMGRRLGSWARSLCAAVTLAVVLLQRRGTVVHFFLPAAYILGGLATWLVGVHPRIMSRRSLNRYQLKHPHYRKVEHFLHPRMDVLVGNSAAVVRELEIEAAGQTPVRLIYNGIEPAAMPLGDRVRSRHELGLDNSSLILVVVANLIPYKGHADLLEGLAQISGGLPEGWRLMCVGRDDGIQSALQAKAADLGIGGNVLWLGARMDVPACLVAADIAVSSSHEEGFSNAVLESMLAGLPTVVTDVGGNPEAVVNGVTGFVVPAQSPEALGQAILRLVRDPQRGAMGARGRARVIETFSMTVCLDAYEALYVESKLM